MIEKIKQKLQNCKAIPTVIFITNKNNVLTYKEFKNSGDDVIYSLCTQHLEKAKQLVR